MENTNHVNTNPTTQTLFEGVISRLESLVERQQNLSQKIYEKTLSTLIQRPVSFESGLNWFQPNKAFESGFTFAQ